jgi:hypothetical protein
MSGTDLLLISFIFPLVTSLVVALLIYGSFARNKWGINIARVACPGCKAELPRLRMPTSLKQALWGGYTCPACHCELDKWGREVSAR